MFRHDRVACLLLGLAVLAGSLPEGAPAGAASTQGVVLPAPQWVGGIDAQGKARLTWIRISAFKAVRVYRRDEGPGTPFRPLAETTDNTWLDDTVRPGRTYRYRLAGIGADGREGRPSSELAVCVGVFTLRPPAVPEWEGYLVLKDGVGLKWAAREGEDVIAWNIYRKTPPEAEFRLVGSSRGSSYQDVGLEPDRHYVYLLTALDSTFRETPFSKELSVTFVPTRPKADAQRPAPAWRVRRTRLVAVVRGGDTAFERPADVAVGPVSGSVYVTDSGRNQVFVFSPQGVFQRTVGARPGEEGAFKNLLGLALDRDENLFVVDAGAGEVRGFTPRGRPVNSEAFPRRAAGPTGLIDAAIGPDGRIHVVDNFNNRVSTILRNGTSRSFGQPGAGAGEFSAPTFCTVDAAGNLFVADCLNARVQVFSDEGEFVRFFGRAERGPGGFGRPKGVAVNAAGEVYVADSWLNTVQVFDGEGRFVAILGDESGRPLDLGSPNGIALGTGNIIYVAERLAARLQIRELIDGQ